MTGQQVVSPAEWQAARAKLADTEAEVDRARAELAKARRELPMVRVDSDYRFEGPDGEVGLAELFEGRRQLIVYHFMYRPEWAEGCPYCSYLVDNIGHLSHLHARDTTLAMVSRAPFAALATFRARMGWSIPWYSARGEAFNRDLGATTGDGELGGVSVFLRGADGKTIYHTYSTFTEGTDVLHTLDNYLDLTPLGRQPGPWLRHHDRYTDSPAEPAAR